MPGTIGAASDFYRLRLVRMDETAEPDLEWRDDILYRRPPNEDPAESQVYRIEAVSLDDDDVSWPICEAGSSDEAHAMLERAGEDLEALTKSRFDDRYGIGAA